MKRIYTAESVTVGHPDKLCDIIADSILDDCLRHDFQSRVACEVIATYGKILVAGEITSRHKPPIEDIVRLTLAQIGYLPENFQVEVCVHRQSSDIGNSVDNSLEKRLGLDNFVSGFSAGAGDQGVMVGYACNETVEMLPLPVVLAHRLTTSLTAAGRTGSIRGLQPDGKAQVSVEYDNGIPVRLDAVVISAQHTEEKDIDLLRFELSDKVLFHALKAFPPDEDTKILLNPSGRFVLGGPCADTGLTGRKLMVDTYGSIVPHGGGAFSGKDPTKVDRSGAYMARYIAKNMVAANLCTRCQVTLAYAIGTAEPIMVQVDTFGTGKICADDCLAAAIPMVFGLTPSRIISQLDLLTPRYGKTAKFGHFGRAEYPWERTDKVKALQDVVM